MSLKGGFVFPQISSTYIFSACFGNIILLELVKRKNPAVAGIHCMIHKDAFASKTLPAVLHSHLEVAIKIVNSINGSALNTRLFRELYGNMDTQHQALPFHT